MATSNETIIALLNNAGIDHRLERAGGPIFLGFDTETYLNRHGHHSLMLAIEVSENGNFIQIIAPVAYTSSIEHRGALSELFLRAAWQFKMVSASLDSTDGEIRLEVQLPMADAALSAAQLRRAISALVQYVESHDEAIRKANEAGIVDLSSAESQRPNHAMVVRQIRATIAELRVSEPDAVDSLLAALIAEHGDTILVPTGGAK